MFSMVNVLAAIILTIPASATANDAAGSGEPSNNATMIVDVVTVNGSGCPLGTTAIAISADETGFTATFSQFMASVGPGAQPTDFRRNCQISMLVHVPTGFTYAFSQAIYSGFMSLAAGTTVTQKTQYYFQGQSTNATQARTFTGPVEAEWTAVDSAGSDALLFAPCGEMRNININTELRMSAGTAGSTGPTSFVTVDRFSGLRFAVKSCQ